MFPVRVRRGRIPLTLSLVAGTAAVDRIDAEVQRARDIWKRHRDSGADRDLQEIYRRGEQHYASGQIHLAAFHFNEVLERGPSDPDLRQKVENRLKLIAKKREGRARLDD